MREITARAEAIPDSELQEIMRTKWFELMVDGARVEITTSGGDGLASLDGDRLELHLTIRPRRGKPIYERIDMIDFALAWALAISKDR